MATEHLHLTLSAEMLARIDEVRRTPAGTVPRNAWIRDAITSRIAGKWSAFTSEELLETLLSLRTADEYIDSMLQARLLREVHEEASWRGLDVPD